MKDVYSNLSTDSIVTWCELSAKMKLMVLFLAICLRKDILGTYIKIKSKSHNVTFRYMGDISGESDLHECAIHEACNIVHNRFWTSSLTERLCLCPNLKECPWEWTSHHENSSLQIDNKSVIKFCNPVTDMKRCSYKDKAAVVFGKSDTNNSYLIPYNVTIHCVCPETHYWRLQKYTYEPDNTLTQVFKCIKKRLCDTEEFCGHIRSDLYSAYYKCTCPENHLCIFRDKIRENVQELLYSGPAYKAYCFSLN